MKTINDTVELNVKGANGETKTYTGPVTYPELENADDVLSVINTEDGLKKLIAAANYGYNLKARASVRADLQNQAAGPDKSINKAVETMLKAMQALGIPMTEEAARKTVLANIEAAKAAA